MRSGLVYMHGHLAGRIVEDDEGFRFTYDTGWLERDEVVAVSLTLPLQREAFLSTTMFPFFDGLIPEGWMLEVATQQWKLQPRDRMGLLLACCRDCVGAVSVLPEEVSDV